MSTVEIKISALVHAAPDTVWQCWTDPQHITGWNFASDDWCCPRATNDLRVGGLYCARMEAKDGSFGFDLKTTYDAIEPGTLLVSTMEDGRNIRTSFEAGATGVQITTIFDAETQNPVEMQRQGWQAILDNFKAYAERA